MNTNNNTANPVSGEGASFETVWAMLQETDRIVKENAIQQKETALQMKETDRQIKEMNKRVGFLNNSFGELAEHLVIPDIKKKFRAFGYNFDKTARRCEITDADGRIAAEVDVWLENGDYVMAVEVKGHLTSDRIEKHIARIERIRRRFDAKGDERKILGAMAGAIFDAEARDYAVSKGLYAISQSGDTVKIDVPEGFVPRKW